MRDGTTTAHTTVSVIVPARNAERFLPLCLDALARSTRVPHEIIVVDDGSNDRTAQIAAAAGARVLRNRDPLGPGAGRNLAAREATGEILMFVDADVVVEPRAVEIVSRVFAKRRDVAALFGSYDDEPAEPNFVSQYKNLFHHHVHQRSDPEAATFWAGLGAIRKDVFVDVGGYDVERYRRPSIEDIEMGDRLRRAGHRILLVKELRGKHLKRWTLGSLIRTDVLHRAIPWARLILETGAARYQLNLGLADRCCAVLVALAVVALVGGVWDARLALAAPLLLGATVPIERDLYVFFVRRKGLLFTLGAAFLHWLYYLYSLTAFGYCWVTHQLAPPAQGSDRARTTPHPRGGYALAALVLVTSVYLVTAAQLSPRVFWSPDSGAKLLQAHALLAEGEPLGRLAYPGRRIDPELRFYPRLLDRSHESFGISRLYPQIEDDGRLVFNWPVWFPGMSIAPLLLFGVAGLHVIPLACGLLTSILAGRLAQRVAPGTAPWAILAVGLGTPIFFYSLLYWEHTLAALLALASLVVSLRISDRAWRGGWVLALLTALMAIRLEMLLFAVALLAALAIAFVAHHRDALRRRWRVLTLAGAMVALLAGVVWALSVPNARWLVGYGVEHAFDPALWLDAPSRLRHGLVGLVGSARPAAALVSSWVALGGIGLCCVSMMFSRRPRLALIVTGSLMLAGYSAQVLLLPWRYMTVSSLLTPAPFLVLGALVVPLALRRPRFETTVLAATTVVYAATGTLAVMTGLEGGHEWGQRYLIALYPLATVSAVVGVHDFVRSLHLGWSKKLLLAVAALLLGLGVGFEWRGVKEIFTSKRMLAAYEAALDTTGRPVVSDVYWLPGALTARFVEDEMYLIGEREKLHDWLRLAKGVVDSFVFVGFTPPDAALIDAAPVPLRRVGERVVAGMSFTVFEIADPAPETAIARSGAGIDLRSRAPASR